MPTPIPASIGLEYVPVVEELCVVTPPPKSAPVAAPVDGEVVSVIVRSYCDSDFQFVVVVLVEPSLAVVVCVCEPTSSAVSAAVRVKA